MEIGAPLDDEFTVEIGGVGFVFPPSSQQDLIYAASLTHYISGELKIQPVDMDTSIRHVVGKIKAINGEITSQGKPLSLDDLKAMANKVRPKFAIGLVSAWAINVLKQSGIYERSEEKNDGKGE